MTNKAWVGPFFNVRRAGFALAAIAVLAMAGCREEEQNRIRDYEPGVYKGQADEALDAETLNALRSRASGQRSP